MVSCPDISYKVLSVNVLLIGDIIYLEALQQRIVVLNSFEHANELLSKKSYSDRPVPMMLGELMGLGQVGGIGMLPLLVF